MELPLPSNHLSNESNRRKNRFDVKPEGRGKGERGWNEGIQNRKMRKDRCFDSRGKEVVGNRKECCCCSFEEGNDHQRSNQSRSRDRR